ncbi:MAG TPA: DUF4097 family beta strand repeat-containing protein [Candidatus Acidoferrales bacterium]|nr:DUF4097 family beta strand repeat-containing protein [Candidatus Acidoferrales bacterium]
MNASSYVLRAASTARTRNAVRVGAFGAFLAGFILAASPAHADRVEKHFAVQSKPKITVRNSSGRIQVKAWTKSEVLVAWTTASGKSVVETEQAGNRVEVATRINDEVVSADDRKTDFEITVPVESELNVRTDSGNVTVDSVHGDMTFDTVGANLQLSDVDGYMVVKTIDGSLVCNRCSGKLEANSISGNVQMIQPTLDSVRVQTSSGNIFFDGSFLSRGIYIMKNFSGTIEVHFASSDSFDVNATSLKGNVINQASFKPDTHTSYHPESKWGHSLFGTMNDGHAKVELSSFSGTIKILKRD